ncbi:MAG TPA: sterol desaturase family protein [Polyangiaceae bacterium]|nr:sterol desaturase family protein [Polyangiaceae bacterium]
MDDIEAVIAFRRRYRAENVGPRYSGWLHFAFTSCGALAAVAFAIAHVHRVRPAEWCVLPLGFLLANGAEYFGHKGPMHRPVRRLTVLFVRHAREHHRFFTSRAMHYDSTRDFKMVLFPAVMLVFFLGAIATPIALALFWCVSESVGWLFVSLAAGYFLTYEWLHFAYHLRPDSWVGRLPLLARLRAHHTRHHDPALMGRYNFNITFPICDWIFGTAYTRPLE